MNHQTKLENIKRHLQLGAFGTLEGESGTYPLERLNENRFLVHSDHQLPLESFPDFQEDLDGFVTTVPRDGIESAHYVSPFAEIGTHTFRIIGWDHETCKLQICSSDLVEMPGLNFIAEDRNVFTAVVPYDFEPFTCLVLKYTTAWNLQPDAQAAKRMDRIHLADADNAQTEKKMSNPILPSLWSNYANSMDTVIFTTYEAPKQPPITFVPFQNAVLHLDHTKDRQLVTMNVDTLTEMISKLREAGLEEFVDQMVMKETKYGTKYQQHVI